jgi:Domain of unknown function (DUF4375)
MKRLVDGDAARREPHLIWNAFIDLIAVEDYDDLSPLQRKMHLVFWYESEVQNGGHGQFFENRGGLRLRETVAALMELGLPCQAKVLSLAAEVFDGADAEADWADVLPRGMTGKLDEAFHSCTPDVTALCESTWLPTKRSTSMSFEDDAVEQALEADGRRRKLAPRARVAVRASS